MEYRLAKAAAKMLYVAFKLKIISHPTYDKAIDKLTVIVLRSGLK